MKMTKRAMKLASKCYYTDEYWKYLKTHSNRVARHKLNNELKKEMY